VGRKNYNMHTTTTVLKKCGRGIEEEHNVVHLKKSSV
jgi:hypothetical protein